MSRSCFNMLHVYVETIELDGETLVQLLLFVNRIIPKDLLGKRKENLNRKKEVELTIIHHTYDSPQIC